MIKRMLNRKKIEVESYNYQIKKQNLKTQFTTFTDPHKFNKNEDFYKANYLLNTYLEAIRL